MIKSLKFKVVDFNVIEYLLTRIKEIIKIAMKR
jgi:hypothetical protein